MRDHTKLRAFELADEVAFLIYGFTSQMGRAVVSVPSNIVEGCARGSQTENLRFLEIAFAFLREVHNQFGPAIRLGYIKESVAVECNLKIVEAEKVLGGLARSIRNS